MVVLDKEMLLMDVHDLGCALQYSIEILEGLEQVFVNCNYTTGNPSEHIRRRRVRGTNCKIRLWPNRVRFRGRETRNAIGFNKLGQISFATCN